MTIRIIRETFTLGSATFHAGVGGRVHEYVANDASADHCHRHLISTTGGRQWRPVQAARGGSWARGRSPLPQPLSADQQAKDEAPAEDRAEYVEREHDVLAGEDAGHK